MKKLACFLCALAFFALFIPATEAASRRPLNYTCESTTNNCTCKGVLDCDSMESRVCGTSVPTCDRNGCTCKWSRASALTRPVAKPITGGSSPGLMKAAPQ